MILAPQEPADGRRGMLGGAEDGLMGTAYALDGMGVELREKESEIDRDGGRKRDAEGHRVSDEEPREGL